MKKLETKWKEYITREIREDDIFLLGETGGTCNGYVRAVEVDTVLESQKEREWRITKRFAKLNKILHPRSEESYRHYYSSLACAEVLACEYKVLCKKKAKDAALKHPAAIPAPNVSKMEEKMKKKLKRYFYLADEEADRIISCLDFSPEGTYGTVRVRKNASDKRLFPEPKPIYLEGKGLKEDWYYRFSVKPAEQIKREKRAKKALPPEKQPPTFIARYYRPTEVTSEFWGTGPLNSLDCTKIRNFLRENPVVLEEHDPNFLENAIAKSINEYPYDPDGYFIYGAKGALDSKDYPTTEPALFGYCVLRSDPESEKWAVTDFYIDPRFEGQGIESLIIRNASRKAWTDVYVILPKVTKDFMLLENHFIEAGFVLESQDSENKTFIFRNSEEA